MVDIKAAVANATDFAQSSLGLQRTEGIRLEEIESSETDGGKPVWLITLSNALNGETSATSLGSLMAAFGADNAREYKIVTAAKDTGEVLSMKIRLLATPTAK